MNRKQLTVKRHQGSYVNGTYQPSAEVALTITASVQPLSKDDTFVYSDKYKRNTIKYKLYTDTKLLKEDEANTQGADVVVIDGKDFEVLDVLEWQNGILNHYKVMVGLKYD
jgi:hypothetical protein